MPVHRSAFTPPPKVMSAVVHITPKPAPEGVSFRTLERLTAAAFGQRRKMLGQSLKPVAGAVEAMESIGIDPARRAETLSVEEFIALARALAAEPAMLLLDEPLSALDARTRLEIRTELRRRLSAFTGPSIVVTHDPLEALVLADRILVLEAGRIVQEGTPSEVARRPATEYVARLMGLNLYSGRLAEPGRVDLDDEGGRLFATESGAEGKVLADGDLWKMDWFIPGVAMQK